MWAVLDADSFFCSVEKVFHPGLDGKPVCVLSSNDGIIVALTREAKALGLKRGDPCHQVRDIIGKGHVTVFSGNMMLYAAMSERIAGIIRSSLDNCIQYSIDESFVNLAGYEKHHNLETSLREVAQKIKLWTDIPVSVGIAPTKTLAKIGSRFAKNYRGYHSVCMIDSDEKRRKSLSMTQLSDIWGLGRRTCGKLSSLGISSPLEFADKDISWVRRNFTKPGIQTWLELNGHPCIDICEDTWRQSITTSRSFGTMVTDKEMLKASVASFAASCAGKLRAQKSLTSCVSVFISSNPFREDLPQYMNMATRILDIPTADTMEITAAALALTESLYRPGIQYKKTGVILDRISCGAYQQDMFDSIANRPQRLELSKAVDSLNCRFGVKSVHLAVEGNSGDAWHVRADHRSQNYLTDINGLLTIHI